MRKWKTIKLEYIHKSPFGNIRKDQCKLPNGIVIDDYYVNEYSDWVNAVVITKENQIVLVEQYRYAGGGVTFSKKSLLEKSKKMKHTRKGSFGK